jgi:hypothetical protein
MIFLTFNLTGDSLLLAALEVVQELPVDLSGRVGKLLMLTDLLETVNFVDYALQSEDKSEDKSSTQNLDYLQEVIDKIQALVSESLPLSVVVVLPCDCVC